MDQQYDNGNMDAGYD